MTEQSERLTEAQEELLASYKFCLKVLEDEYRIPIEIIKTRIKELEDRLALSSSKGGE